MRRRLPWFLVDRGIAGKGAGDCGAHEWYNHDGVVARCYHCEAGARPWPAALACIKLVKANEPDIARPASGEVRMKSRA